MSYRARWIRFIFGHWEEIGADGTIPSSLRDEFDHLKSGRLCSCGTSQQAETQLHEHGGAYESKMPSATYLDLVCAYDALPISSRGRTEAWLLQHGVSEQRQYEMTPSEWMAHHRNRIRVETSRPGYKESPHRIPGGGSVWEQMARFLNGAAEVSQSVAGTSPPD